MPFCLQSYFYVTILNNLCSIKIATSSYSKGAKMLHFQVQNLVQNKKTLHFNFVRFRNFIAPFTSKKLAHQKKNSQLLLGYCKTPSRTQVFGGFLHPFVKIS